MEAVPVIKIKRKRTQNFTVEEKMLFVRTLQDIGGVLITKVTSHNSHTNKEKEAAWEKITNQLNATGFTVRNVDSYKKLWAKLKSEAKTYKSKALHQFRGTGGGPSEIHSDPVLDAVIEITGRGSTGIEGVIDGDAAVNVEELIPLENAIVQIQDDHMIQDVEAHILPLDDHMIQDVEAHIPLDDHMIQDVEAHIPLESKKVNDYEILLAPNKQNINKENQKTPVNNIYKRRRPFLAQSNERTTLHSTQMAEMKLMIEQKKLDLLKTQEEIMREQNEIKKKMKRDYNC